MQQVVVLFGGNRWGKEYVADMIRAAGATIAWPDDLPTQAINTQAAVTVVALDDFVAEAAVLLAQQLQVPFYCLQSHETTFYKNRLRAIWNQQVSHHPQLPLQYIDFEYLPSQTPSTQPWQVPVIVKPNAYSGSVGVQLVNNPAAINTAVQGLQNLLQQEQQRFAGDFAVCQDILLEAAIPRQNMPGSNSEFTLHMLSRKGQHQLLTTSEKQLAADAFVEIGHTVPAPNLPAHLLTQMVAITKLLLTELQVVQCISNWEYIVTPDNKIALVEGQLRPSGDRLMQLIQLATGINPFEALLTGNTIPTQNRTAAIRWLGPQDIEVKGDDITIPNLPENWETQINKEALLQNPNWPGPVDWYNRHVAVIGTLD